MRVVVVLFVLSSICLPALAYEHIRILPNGYLGTSDGQAFIPMGGFYANWPGNARSEDRIVLPAHDIMPPGAAPYRYPFSWRQERDIKDWFAYCRDNGVTALRLMLRGMDIVGKVDQTKLEAVMRYLDLAQPYGIRFQVVLFEDFHKPPYVNQGNLDVFIAEYSEEELSGLPSYRKRFLVDKRLATDKYDDPDVFECQKDYLKELIPALRERPEIFAYELENEMVGDHVEWCRQITKEIRELDSTRPIIANPLDISYPHSRRLSETGIDLLNYHPYQHGNPHSGMNSYFMARAKQSDVTVPVYAGEAGLNSTTGDKVQEWESVLIARDNIWNGILSGYIGSFMWAPQYKGEVEEHRTATMIFDAFDFTGFERKQPDIAVVLPEIEEELEVGHLHPMMAWAEFSQNTGYDYDLTMNPSEERAVMVPLETRPEDVDVSDIRAPFSTNPEYLIQYLLSADERKALIFLANRAGGINMGTTNAWQRSKEPSVCRLKLDLPPGRYTLSIYNLDDGGSLRTRESRGTVWVNLGRSSDDFAVIVKRED